MTAVPLIKPLHGLRGIAALTVVLGHFIAGGTPALGVVLFFVLSGFLIGRLYLSKPLTRLRLWHYLVARFARIYPLFAAVIITTAVFNWISPARIFGLKIVDVVPHLLLMGDASTVWTISVEFQFYFLFIAVWATLAWFKSPYVVIVGVVALTLLAAAMLGQNASRIGPLGYMHIFALGLLVSHLTADPSQTWKAAGALCLPLFCVGYAIAFFVIPHFYDPRWVYLDPVGVGICLGLVATVLLGGTSLTNRLLSLPVFVWLGDISFGIYLLHRHAQTLINFVVDGPWWITLPAKLAVTLLIAHLANRCVERPCRAWIRNAAGLTSPKT